MHTRDPHTKLVTAREHLRLAAEDLQDREDAPIEALRGVIAWVDARIRESEEGETNG